MKTRYRALALSGREKLLTAQHSRKEGALFTKNFPLCVRPFDVTADPSPTSDEIGKSVNP